ncbi:hypothetical protein BVRB_1g010450 [Beta vulgaris subsp. vulgaris]|nr:hypothetical protein BVRB_1g010450 [Beta vulgaris subsp. vulgaris]
MYVPWSYLIRTSTASQTFNNRRPVATQTLTGRFPLPFAISVSSNA